MGQKVKLKGKIKKSPRPTRIIDVGVDEEILEILESFYNDERLVQRRAGWSQKPFRAAAEAEGEVEEAEDETAEDQAVQGAIPQSSKEKPKPAKQPENPAAEPVNQERGPPIPSYDLMREKMNLIRSGKSLKEDHVDAEMREYFETMSDDEKLALIAYLTGISQIVAGEVSARKVSDPSESPWKINMSRSKRDQERTARKTRKGKEQKGTEDAPIVVGESADKSRELELIRQLIK